MATNAQRQAAFKAKMREAGKKQMTIWADPGQQAAIMAFLAGRFVTSNDTAVPACPLACCEQGEEEKR